MTEHLSATQSKESTTIRNILVALSAIVLSIGLFFGLQTENASASLEVQAKNSIPLEVAVSNGKPTLTEFYANWCTSCQAMAQDLAKVKQKYGNSINFVMLNVDNTKWLPEVLRYRVDGIPHFVYLGREGQTIAQTIGEQPRSILEANLDALAIDKPIPYAHNIGQISDFNAVLNPSQANQDDPRSHSSQVKS